MKIPFVGQSYSGRSRDINYQILENWYLEQDPTGKSTVALLPIPGLRFITSSGSGPCRGNGIIFQGNAYFVINNMLVKFDGAVLTSIGAINTISSRIQIAENGTQLMIVDGTNGWTYDGTTFAQITDGDFPVATQVKYIDSYFVVNSSGTGRFYISGINDGTTWSALDFATAQRSPDNLIALEVIHRELWLFGTASTEVWYNSGASDFPFAPVQGGFIEWGCAAPFSIAKVDNNIVWLAQKESGGPVIVKTTGFQPEVISTSALNFELSTYGTYSDAEAYAYTKAGHDFYEISFPRANKTWQYDALTKQWNTIKSGTARHRTSGHVFLNGKNYAGDKNFSNIYEIDFNTYNELLSPVLSAALTRSGGTVTATVASHPFLSQDLVTIKGADQSAYNGLFLIQNVTTNTFDYLISGTPATPATGTITASLESTNIRVRTSPHIHKDQKRIIYHSLEIDFESGIGLVYGQGSDPTASLRWSDDGGHTWSYSHQVSIGALGKYKARAKWYRLGSSRDRIYELTVSDPVKAVVIGANAEVTVCES